MKTLFTLIILSTLFATRLLVPEQYPTIQEGIDASSDGDTVLVSQGIYYESLFLDKSITLTSYAIFDDPSDWAYFDGNFFQWMPNPNIASTIIDGSTEYGETGGFQFGYELFINSCITIFSQEGSGCIEPTIMGFTIQNGQGDLYTPADGSEPVAKGGAFFIHDAIPKINYNYIRSNGTHDYNGMGYSTLAGGAANLEPEDWDFENTLLTSSREECEISSLDFTHNIYRDNISSVGGVLSNTIEGAVVDISGSIVPIISCDGESIVISSQNYIGGELIAEDIVGDLCAISSPEVYVNPNIEFECNDETCGSLPNPFKTITRALAMTHATEGSPATIYLFEGIYSPSNNGETFPIILIDNIHLQGENQENTIIDAQQTNRVLRSYGINSTTISNLTITGGDTSYSGGGIKLESSDIILDNVTINENSGGNGGGMYLWMSSPVLVDVNISNNTAQNGGGMYLWTSHPSLIYTEISGNEAEYGGGITLKYSNPILTDVIINLNSAFHSGGMRLSHSNPILTHVSINHNTGEAGAGIRLYDSSPILTYVTINDNIGANEGGGIYSWAPLDSTSTGSNPILTNVTITRNSAVSGSGMRLYNSYPIVINTIIWDNDPDPIYLGGGSTPIITYSDIQSGWQDGEGNIDEDPLFVDPENGDFTTQEGSPCIDTGTADIDGDGVDDIPIDQYYGTAPDIGAFEYYSPDYCDLNFDGEINILDVILVINCVLLSEGCDYLCMDYNEDGNIDILDIIMMINIILEN